MPGWRAGIRRHALGGERNRRERRENPFVPTVEVSRTLVKSPPELWAELSPRLEAALEGATVQAIEPECELRFDAKEASGTVLLEPSSWGTKVTLAADVRKRAAGPGLLARLLGAKAPEPLSHDHLEERLSGLLDRLGQAHRKPFVRS